MAAKKSTTKKTAAKKSPAKKEAPKKENKVTAFYTRDVSLLFAITVEALILILGYLIIMSKA